eukprot:gene35683-43278_t
MLLTLSRILPFRHLKRIRSVHVYQFSLQSGRSRSIDAWQGCSMLVVGDGDFSFSRSLAEQRMCSHLVTSTLDSKDFVTASFLSAAANIAQIEELGGQVHYGVDATKISQSFPNRNFDVILWNFPHIAGKQNIKHNRRLLHQYLVSAATSLSLAGKIMISLCEGQSGTRAKSKLIYDRSWKLLDQATAAGLLVTESEPFPSGNFPAYTPMGHRGHGGTFRIGNAQLFTLQKPGPNVVAKLCNVFSHELHLLSPHTLPIDQLPHVEAAARAHIQQILADTPYQPMHLSALLVDVFLCPRGSGVSYALQVALACPAYPLQRDQLEPIRETLERTLPDLLSLRLRERRRGMEVCGPHPPYTLPALLEAPALNTDGLVIDNDCASAGQQLADALRSLESDEAEEEDAGARDWGAFVSAHKSSPRHIRDLARVLWGRKASTMVRGDGRIS